jgi:hypothetical protein
MKPDISINDVAVSVIRLNNTLFHRFSRGKKEKYGIFLSLVAPEGLSLNSDFNLFHKVNKKQPAIS